MLVDSSVWVDFFNGTNTPETDYLSLILGKEELFVGDLIVSEVLQGFRNQKDYVAAKKALLSFPVLGMVGQEMAIRSANNYRRLKRKGITVRKTIDCLIATFCIETELPLLHSDSDFIPFVKHLNLRTPFL